MTQFIIEIVNINFHKSKNNFCLIKKEVLIEKNMDGEKDEF